MKAATFICPPMPADQAASAGNQGRLDHRVGGMVVTREWYYDHLARHIADLDREPFTSPPRQKDVPSWHVIVFYGPWGAMRRIWTVDSNQVSPRCWRWLTSGYGPSSVNQQV
jgi:hypothetical protein